MEWIIGGIVIVAIVCVIVGIIYYSITNKMSIDIGELDFSDDE